jgi:hypothetical protein
MKQLEQLFVISWINLLSRVRLIYPYIHRTSTIVLAKTPHLVFRRPADGFYPQFTMRLSRLLIRTMIGSMKRFAEKKSAVLTVQ